MTDVSTETELNHNQKWIRRIAWAGVAPMALCLFYAWLKEPALPALLFLTFSAVVLAFVVGAQWGQILIQENGDEDLRPPLIVTAMVGLAAWTALFLGEPLLSTIALLIGNAIAYATENRFLRSGQPVWYRNLRLQLTTVVALMHGLLILRYIV